VKRLSPLVGPIIMRTPIPLLVGVILLLFAMAWLIRPRLAFALGESCSVSANSTAFGGYTPFNSSATDSTGNVRVTCTSPLFISVLVSYTISLSTGGSASYSPRAMASGAHTLNYNLYTNTARTTVWGNGTSGTSTVSDSYSLVSFGSVSRDYPVYGRIPALQNAFTGSYTDTITVTLNY
jgi:spore coat protein U-like protein